MAEINIVSLVNKTTPQNTDYVIVQDTAVTPQKTKKMSWQNLVKPVNNTIGALSSLTTSVKTSVVGSINSLKAELGNPSALLTTTKTNLVAAINELAEETTSTAFTFPGSTPATGADAPRARKKGKAVQVTGFVTPTAGGTTRVAVLPVGYRPDTLVDFASINKDNNAAVRAWVNTDGEIYIVATLGTRMSIGTMFFTV